MKLLNKAALIFISLVNLHSTLLAQPGITGVIYSDPRQIIDSDEESRLHTNMRALSPAFDLYITGVTFKASEIPIIVNDAVSDELHYGLVFYHGLEISGTDKHYVAYLVKDYIYINQKTHFVVDANGNPIPGITGRIENMPFALADISKINYNGAISTPGSIIEIKNNINRFRDALTIQAKKPVSAVSFFHHKQLQDLLAKKPDKIKLSLGERPDKLVVITFSWELHTVMSGIDAAGTKVNQLILDRSWPPTVWQK